MAKATWKPHEKHGRLTMQSLIASHQNHRKIVHTANAPGPGVV
jgi:hypothetical protein